MKLYGIIGRPLGHSLSKDYFETKFADLGLSDCRFEKFVLPDISALDEVLSRHAATLRGFCVTIPYKKDIISRLDAITDEALAIGAVNCVRVTAGGRLEGHNTDAHGFRVGLETLLGAGDLTPCHTLRAIVLGTGGASCAVRHVLGTAGIDHLSVSRTPTPGQLAYTDLTPDIMAAHHLIINTTPLGTTPDIHTKPPIPYSSLTPRHHLYDLVYNPPQTAFLAEGARRGAKTINGLPMFRNQAEKNWQLWNSGETP